MRLWLAFGMARKPREQPWQSQGCELALQFGRHITATPTLHTRVSSLGENTRALARWRPAASVAHIVAQDHSMMSAAARRAAGALL